MGRMKKDVCVCVCVFDSPPSVWYLRCLFFVHTKCTI